MNTANLNRPVTDEDVQEWKTYVGRQKVQSAMADAELLRRFALAAGIDSDVERAAPALSHWTLFVEAVADEKIGPDGHPKRGDFLPNVYLPRRMFAASEMTFHEQLTLGKVTQMTSTIGSVAHKAGRSGDLVFVKVQREVSQGDKLCTTEEQTIVYRPEGAPIAAVEELELPETTGAEIWNPGPVQLFRFSAVTYNSHRIHYDAAYATNEEGYPGLVVHGPFTAVKLLDYACRRADKLPHQFSFRGVAPMFVSQQIQLSAGEEPNSFLAMRCDGNTGMSAEVQFC